MDCPAHWDIPAADEPPHGHISWPSLTEGPFSLPQALAGRVSKLPSHIQMSHMGSLRCKDRLIRDIGHTDELMCFSTKFIFSRLAVSSVQQFPAVSRAVKNRVCSAKVARK